MPLTDDRDHFYLTKCNDCLTLNEKHDKKPITAARHACEHAQKTPGHSAYVINVNLLKVVHRYQFDKLTPPPGGVTEPPF